MSKHPPLPEATEESGSGCVVRLLWMVLGPIVAGVCAAKIAGHQGSFGSIYDIVYWGIAFALVFIRYADIRWLKGATGAGTPASLADWRRYAVILAMVAVVVWAGAHAVARFLA